MDKSVFLLLLVSCAALVPVTSAFPSAERTLNFNNLLSQPIYVNNIIPDNYDINATNDLRNTVVAELKAPQWIAYHGYQVEVHLVTTEDGYVLEMHRILSKKKNEANNYTIYLQHGILTSSMDWVIAGPKKGLGFLLADLGYDVWLGNVRGNTYSRKHVNLTTDDAAFWDFSWHEMGMYDLPAMIDYTLAKTGHKKLFYIGHSQGTTAFFVMASMKPEYNDKIYTMFALAPVVFCSNMFSPLLKYLSTIEQSYVSTILDWLGIHEFAPTNKFISKFAHLICRNAASKSIRIDKLCRNTMFLITGFDSEQFEDEILDIVFYHVPAGASARQFRHFAQLIYSGDFRQFNFGFWENKRIYGQYSSPHYDLSKVTAPVSLHYSLNDWISNEQDVRILGDKLPNLVGKYRLPNSNFNHADYLWAKDVRKMLYSKLLSLIKRETDSISGHKLLLV